MSGFLLVKIEAFLFYGKTSALQHENIILACGSCSIPVKSNCRTGI